MAYVAVRGGQAAIEASIHRLGWQRARGLTVLGVVACREGLQALVDQVMSEASLYDEDTAALAIKQAEGSPEEAVFLLRAHRSTLARKYYSRAMGGESLRLERRISACFKDIPGGQILGSSRDYTHRLLNGALVEETLDDLERLVATFEETVDGIPLPSTDRLPKVTEYLRQEGLLARPVPDLSPPGDVTKQYLTFPARRSERLQTLTRGQTGAVSALGYASMRGYGSVHPTVSELRVGLMPVTVPDPLGGSDAGQDEDYYVGEIRVTEVESLIPVAVPRGPGVFDLRFDLGYGCCFGQNETKTIAMSILDQCLETPEEPYPTHDEEFVLSHIDAVETTGFLSHLKLPHYVTFQAKLDALRHQASREKP